ncbi:MAG: FHA domain-containing protein [Chloroflexaceae bacterium]|nr:FHA domain-containing protein [Chloroflexaceae bacterium]
MPSYGRLRVLFRDQLIQTVELTQPDICIGQASACDVHLDNPYVASQHARLYRRGAQWMLQNLHAAAPVRMHGRPVSDDVPLTNGAEFTVGPVVIQVTLTPFASDPADGDDTVSLQAAAPVLTVSYQQVVREYPLEQSEIHLGRASENDIVIPVSTVSRRHAVLQRQRDGYVLLDRESRNGLIYHGQRVKQHRLADGDVLRIIDDLGNFVHLSYADVHQPPPVQTGTLHFAADQHELTIGRAQDNAVCVNHPMVSAHHAVLKRQGQDVFVLDLGSTNGTYVGGQRVVRAPIQPGDVIQIACYQFIYREDALAPTVTSNQVRLDACNLSVQFDTHVLLNDVSLSIYPRELVAVVGGSGTGKSTLLNALSGVRPATGGTVQINGDDYYAHFAAYRRSLGYVPQDDTIHLDLTVERNLEYAARLRLPADLSAAEIAARVDQVLTDVDMQPQRQQRVGRLSGGQRKRVSIAMELLAQPNLFFLDEPTTGLDPGLDKRMMSLLRSLADQGRTVVLVTHATTYIQETCDTVAFMGRGGRLCFYGPLSEAMQFFGVQTFSDIYTCLEHDPAAWEQRFRQSPCYQQYITQRLHAPSPWVPRGTQGRG